jgi:hypothetical protein
MYAVQTDLDPAALGELAVETYKMWVEFAIGKTAIGGKMLRHPTGNYASHIHQKKTGPNTVEIWADEGKNVPESKIIEDGSSGADLKQKMLSSPKAHTSEDGYRYRIVPIKAEISGDGLEVGITPKGMRKISATTMRAQNAGAKFIVMSDNPKNAPWKVPPMSPYAPAQLLADLVKASYGKGGNQ